MTATFWPGTKGEIEPVTGTVPKIGALPPRSRPTWTFSVADGGPTGVGEEAAEATAGAASRAARTSAGRRRRVTG